MKFALTSNQYKDPAYQVLIRVHQFLKERGVEVLVDLRNCAKETEGLGFHFTSDFRQADLVLSLGGDGTFLNAVHFIEEESIPIVGINLGSVGFLAQIELETLEGGLERLVKGDYSIEERMRIEARCYDEDGRETFRGIALNEVLLSRGSSQRIIPLQLNIDGTPIEIIRCDGLIVGTATGSTGYAMAAGGPIIAPNLSVIEVTPVCPYALHSRTYLLSPDNEISLEMHDYPFEATLSVDGREQTPFLAGHRAVLTRYHQPLKLVRLQEHPFFQNLPEKLRDRSSSGLRYGERREER